MNPEYNFAFLDEGSKREIRRSILKAVAVPGYQVPFGSRELPIGRGWGTGGIQLTLSLIGPRDVLKVIDQGSDDSVNAVNIKKFINLCSDVATTTDSTEATLIQTRHRIPEEPLRNDQLLVFQVPLPEPLRVIEPSEEATKLMHAEADYTGIWLQLYESIMKYGKVTIATEYPVTVEDRYVMNPSPIPKYDNPRLHESECLYLFGAGARRKFMRYRLIQRSCRWRLTMCLLRSNIWKAAAAVYVERKMFILTSLSTERQALSAISARIQVTALNEGCARRRTADAY